LTFLKEASVLLFDKSAWEVIPAIHHQLRHRHLAFAMISRALCGVQANLHTPSKGYPLRLFRLLVPADRHIVAEELGKGRPCMLDTFTTKFVDTFRGRLLSDESLACLTVLGTLVDLDVSEIECLHASIRRLLHSRVQTWSKQIGDVSSDWMTARSRNLHHGGWWSDPLVEESSTKKQKQGGGTHRSYFSSFLKGQKMPDKDNQQLTY
jgi:hypothetical protein